MRWMFILLITSIVLSACAAPSEAAQTTAPIPTPLASTSPVPRSEPMPGIPASWLTEFSTDFSLVSVPLEEILSGGPPKDGIPAIDAPEYVSVSEADAWLADVEPVVFVQAGEDTRAYPIQILMWHEIVNDTLGDLTLAITFCPLCNTAIAFDRRIAGQTLDFGTTGRLRYSNLIMYDRQTETWWQQADGRAIIGTLLGERLSFYPAAIIAWSEYRNRFPQGSVLSRETGFPRRYGENPYTGYDDVDNPPFLYRGPAIPGELAPVARVLTLELAGETVAYPYDLLAQVGVINDQIGDFPVLIVWQAGVASPLDTLSIAEGRDVGTAVAFDPTTQVGILTFRNQDGSLVDEQTGSTWNIFGQAVAGELVGTQLTTLRGFNHFWFSWAAFQPNTRIYNP